MPMCSESAIGGDDKLAACFLFFFKIPRRQVFISRANRVLWSLFPESIDEFPSHSRAHSPRDLGVIHQASPPDFRCPKFSAASDLTRGIVMQKPHAILSA